jgi:hypothetical protein
MAASEVADTRQEIGQVDRKSLAVHIEDHHDAAEKGHTATNRYAHVEMMYTHTNTTIDTVDLLSDSIPRSRRSCSSRLTCLSSQALP